MSAPMPYATLDQSSKVTAAWLAARREDVRLCGMPRCRVCRGPVRRGGFADPFWPYFDMTSRHAKCRREEGPR